MRTILAITMLCSASALAGSAREAATVAIDTNLNGRTLEIFKTLNHRATNYVRSSTCWAFNYDLSCIAVYNSFGMSMSTNPSSLFESATRRAGTLISPRHLIYADHYQIPHGTELRFVAQNNTHVSRAAMKQLGGGHRLTPVDLSPLTSYNPDPK